MGSRGGERERQRVLAAGACLAVSGAASLVYEIAWLRQAALVFGSSTFAAGTVLGVFFLGLAGGSELAGRIAPSLARPLRAFAGLEALVAVWALASSTAFAVVEEALVALHDLSPARVPLLLGRLLLVAGVVLPPTLLMGASMPLVCRAVVRRDGDVGRGVAELYGLNTLGATIGCLATGYLLLPTLGTSTTLRVAAGLNLAAALGALVLARGSGPVHRAERAGAPGPARSVLGVLAFLLGVVALGYEVLWSRVLALVLRNTVQTWTLTLAAMLVGIVVGSLIAAPMIDRARRRAWWLGLAEIAGVLAVLAALALPPAVWRAFGGAAAVLLVVPAACWGAAFPVLVRIGTARAEQTGAAVGRLTALNGVGGVAGSLLIGFVGVPVLGISTSAHLLTGVGVVAGVGAWLLLEGREHRRTSGLAAAGAVVVWVTVPWLGDTRLPHDHLVGPGEDLVAVVEGRTGSLAVVRRGHATSLEIDRWWQGGNWRNHQAVAAYVPLLLHPAPSRVLVVGAGTGQTPGSALLVRDVRHVDVVDIEPAVFDVIRAHFRGAWLDDPRVRLVADDGRHHLLLGGADYDVISLELGQVFVPAVAAFYTTEFYERLRRRLRPGGVVAQFVPSAFLQPEVLQRVLASFRSVFPQCLLWYNTSELLLLGTAGESWRFPRERLALLRDDPALHAALAYAHWGGPEHYLHHPPVFLSGLLAGPAEIARLAGAVGPLVDDVPVLEYAAAAVDDDAELERGVVRLLREHLADTAAVLGLELSAADAATVRSVRAHNLNDMIARAVLRRAEPLRARGDHAALLGVAEAALSVHPESWQARRLRGASLASLGQVAAALPDLRAVVRLQPDDVEARRALGFALHRSGRPEDAIAHYRAALAGEPGQAEVHKNLGAALAAEGALAEAATHLRIAVRLRPDDVGARQNLQQVERLLQTGGAAP